MADGERREFLARLPLGGEGCRPAGIAVEIPLVVGERECAVRPALEQKVAADPENEEIQAAVAINIDGIGADDVGQQLGIGADVERLLLELERSAGLRPVDEELRRILAPGRNTDEKPEPSQSSAAPPPPTKNSQGPS